MQRFATLCQEIAATTSKLRKIGLLADYLATLSDAELPIACLFLTGRPFPQWEERELEVGYASIRDVVYGLSGCSQDAFYEAVLRHGDLGDACAELLATSLPQETQLSLVQVQEAFNAIAYVRGAKKKAELLQQLLSQASPPQARFIIKVITADLRIGLDEGLVEEGIAKLSQRRLEEVKRANMLLGDIGQTAFLARQGRLGEARMRLFHPIGFMLASPIAEAQEASRIMPGSLYVEDKYDGIRAQVHKGGEQVAIYSRTLDQVTHRFPELVSELLALEGDLILDGEILAYRDGSSLPFALLQHRLGRKEVDQELVQQVPVVYVAFDLIYLKGEVLIPLPLSKRRTLLESLKLSGRLMLSQLRETNSAEELEALFREARARGNEGLMIKDPTSPYKPGKRGKSWLKLKRPFATLDVVVTAVEWGHGKRRNVLSDYSFAVRDGGELKNIGKAYSGLTDREIAELTEWFKAHTLHDFGPVRQVEPRIVIEVAFDAVQRSNRHRSGYALRFPRILRLRPDKGLAQISTLSEVRALAERLKRS